MLLPKNAYLTAPRKTFSKVNTTFSFSREESQKFEDFTPKFCCCFLWCSFWAALLRNYAKESHKRIIQIVPVCELTCWILWACGNNQNLIPKNEIDCPLLAGSFYWFKFNTALTSNQSRCYADQCQIPTDQRFSLATKKYFRSLWCQDRLQAFQPNRFIACHI